LTNFDNDITPPEIKRQIIEEDVDNNGENAVVDIGILDLGHRVTK
jgi:hypothetical protein